MAEPASRLYLITPVLEDASFAPQLAEACAAGAVAAVLLRLAAADERSLTNLVKALAPAAQEHGAALTAVAGPPSWDQTASPRATNSAWVAASSPTASRLGA